MDSIPAKLAGCKNLVMVTPPSADGKINPAILAAAKIAGIDRIFKVGGAQAIAALAYGNREHSKGGQDSGPRKRLCGGGKKAGLRQSLHRHDSGSQRDTGHPRTKKASPPTSPPTSFPRLSTTASRARFLSQTPPSLADKVSLEIERQLKTLPREEIARASIDNNGKIIVVDSISEAVEISNRIALSISSL